MKNLLKVALGASALLMVFSIYPRKVMVAPALDLLVRDETGKPASGVLLSQDWGYQAPGATSQTVSLRSDQTGHAGFPPRSVRVSSVQKLAAAALDLVSLGHYGRGPHAQVWAYGTDPTVWTFVYCSVQNQQPHEIDLKRSSVAIYPRP